LIEIGRYDITNNNLFSHSGCSLLAVHQQPLLDAQLNLLRIDGHL
jgi:hypothetical protein